MMTMMNLLLGRTKVTVTANERALVICKGRFVDILDPGEHMVPSQGLEIERHDLTEPQFAGKYLQALRRMRPDLVQKHLTEIRTVEGEVTAIFRDGAFWGTLRETNQRMTVWTDAGPWDVKQFALTEDLIVPAEMRQHFAHGTISRAVKHHLVPQGHVGLLTVDGVFVRTLEEGVHPVWNVNSKAEVRTVDTRWRAHDVTGQEVLTADRVTVRVNIAADVRVVDPVRATTAVRDFDEALHRALQFAFRKTLGTRTLDQMLAEKVTVDAEAADKVRAEMAEIGLEVGEIALKDVILPGEMRDILNKVVAAEKEAEANVIRRREETQATRALLNTAKVMEENPVMLRLKELEALTELAGKVDNLTVHNGTAGLMNDLVKLRD